MRGAGAMFGSMVGLLCLAACSFSSSPSSTTFTLTGASVDPTYQCPGGANNAPYDLHATIDVRNGTARAVTISDVKAEMKLIAVKAEWPEKVGDRYDAGSVKFEPSDVPAGAGAKLRVTIPSACTSGAYGANPSRWGRYQVTMHLVTSSGAFSISAANPHEIEAA